jgi:hypothetical protein
VFVVSIRLDGVQSAQIGAVHAIVQGLLGAHEDDLDVQVTRQPDGTWRVVVVCANEARPSLLPTWDRDAVYGDVAEALVSMLRIAVP